ncbi:MAG: helix-turn-helix transcriptional regulator [Sideroxyarcus sp.]
MQSHSNSKLTKLKRLKSKGFRDAYVKATIEQGIAYQIRALRTQRGLSQKELALKLGKTQQSAIARLEDPSYGKFSLSTLEELSAAFDVALLVKFVPYSRLLEETDDLSPAAISAESFEVEYPKIEAALEVAIHEYTGNYLSPQEYDSQLKYATAAPVDSIDSIFFGV